MESIERFTWYQPKAPAWPASLVDRAGELALRTPMLNRIGLD